MSDVRYNHISLPTDFWQRVAKDAKHGCWLWLRGCTAGGYGQLSVGTEKGLLAHRLVYANLAGPLVAGLVLHHTCANRACVNPAHLIQLTRRSHIALEPQGAALIRSRKTHCPKGHPYSGDNLVLKPSDRGRRRCRTCVREQQRCTA